MSFRFVGKLRRALARLARRLAQRWDPVTIPPSESEAIPVGAVRFRVVRDGRTLYDGPSGAKARDRFLHVKRDDQSGIVELWMGNVLRDHS